MRNKNGKRSITQRSVRSPATGELAKLIVAVEVEIDPSTNLDALVNHYRDLLEHSLSLVRSGERVDNG